MDCHGAGNGWSFNSLIPDRLDPRCEFVVQREWTDYTEFSSRAATPRCSSASTPAPATPDGGLNHTVSSTHWRSVKFNGVEVGEVGINAALCGTWGCPVLLVTGDEAVCRESTELLGPA